MATEVNFIIQINSTLQKQGGPLDTEFCPCVVVIIDTGVMSHFRVFFVHAWYCTFILVDLTGMQTALFNPSGPKFAPKSSDHFIQKPSSSCMSVLGIFSPTGG